MKIPSPGTIPPAKWGTSWKVAAFSRHNHTGEQGIFGVHMGAAFNSRDHRDTYISDVLHNLNAFIMNLAPNTGIGKR